MKLDPLDDIHFWSRQLSEHALFFNLGLEVEPYKSQAAALHRDWETARGRLAQIATAPNIEAAKAIVAAPTKNLAEFKEAVLAEQGAGKWVGWLFPLFVSHTLRELIYFVARVWHGGLPPEHTYCENIRFMQEHAEFAAHLLDPSAKDLIAAAESAAKSFADLRSGCSALTLDYINLGRKAGQGLDQYLKTQPVSAKSGRSVIHPVLADHVIREGERFLATMDELAQR